MKSARRQRTTGAVSPRWMAWLYTATLTVMALTGFGQMPIYNRYYLSDIPGLGWLADFYFTRNIHYAGAALLLALLFYSASDFLLMRRKNVRLTPTGILRMALLTGVLLSGALIVVKNLPYVYFADGFIIGVNLAHLTLVSALVAVNLICAVYRKGWAAAA